MTDTTPPIADAMTDPTARDLIQRLADSVELLLLMRNGLTPLVITEAALDEARAYLAQPEPLSHAAQAVRRDFAQIMQELNQRCRVSISATDTLPITLETNNALLEAGINSLCAAALRAAVTATQSRQYEGCWICRASDILAIAAELEGQ